MAGRTIRATVRTIAPMADGIGPEGPLEAPIASLESDRPDKTLVVIRHIQVIDADSPLSGGCVDEFIVTDIDAHMAEFSPRVEEEKVPFHQFAA